MSGFRWLLVVFAALAVSMVGDPAVAQPGNTPPSDQPTPEPPVPDTSPPDTPSPDTPSPDTSSPDTSSPDTPSPDTAPSPDTSPPDTAPAPAAPPGSTPPTASPTGAGPGAAPTATPGRIRFGPEREPLSAAEAEVLRQAEIDFLRFQEAANGHHRRLREILITEFADRSAALEKRYAERIRRAEAEKKKRHLDTIALLEKFIEEHPGHPQFTPDAMFRLANLYLDQAERELEEREAAGNFDDPVADYSKSLALWERILQGFPEYRQRPGTLYLLAYYGRVVDERRSLTLFLALVCANKHNWNDAPPSMPTREQAKAVSDSRELVNPYSDCVPARGADDALLQHAWVRGVGDHHFSIPGELNEAIAAYSKMDTDETAPLYAEGLYKLAWSYYRRDFLIEAIDNFDKSVRIYDQTIAAGKQPKLELRDEALQYIAVSFTDPWDGEPDADPVVALERAEKYYGQRQDEPHVRDVWETLGRAFMEIQAYDQAITCYRKAIDPPWHLHPQNPIVHQEIVNAYEEKGDKFGADNAAGELAIRYGPGTPWYIENEKDREAMDNQRRIGERMLYAAARNMHSTATAAREDYDDAGVDDPIGKQNYLDLYQLAVKLYQSFLDQYPESEHVYVFTFGLAEALFFSEQYMRSVEHYRWVRDHKELSSKHYGDAAYSIIQAYEAEADRQLAANQVTAIQVPSKEQLESLPKPIQPMQIPPIYIELQKAYDEYQKLINDPKTAPQMALNAAIISMAHLHIDDAIRRFEVVLENFCGASADEVVRAKDGLLAIYDVRGQDEKFKETNDSFIVKQCGNQEAIELAQSQNRSIEFRKATQLFAEQKFPEAARAFYIYYKTAPDDDKDLPTALYNSAIAFREADKPKTSIHLLQEFTGNKSDSFRKSPYYLSALRLTAREYQGVYDYKKAIEIFMELYEKAKRAKIDGLTPPPPPPGEKPQTFEQIKLNALYNAAVLSELDRNFSQAIKLYRKYEREESDTRQKDRTLWAIARIYRSSGDVNNLIKTYKAWRKKYGNEPINADDYVFSYYDVANAYIKRKRFSDAQNYREQTLKAWERKGSKPATKGARYAGEFALYFAERKFNKKYVPFKIKRQARTKKQALSDRKRIDKITKEMQTEFLALGRFEIPEYSMAGKVRLGDVLSLYAQKVFEVPTPKYMLDLDARAPEMEVLAKYETNLAAALQTYVDQAKQQWIDVRESGKNNKVSNKWTRLALENLNREFPDEYPILHEELNDGTEEP